MNEAIEIIKQYKNMLYDEYNRLSDSNRENDKHGTSSCLYIMKFELNEKLSKIDRFLRKHCRHKWKSSHIYFEYGMTKVTYCKYCELRK
jgi:hypothetical protein